MLKLEGGVTYSTTQNCLLISLVSVSQASLRPSSYCALGFFPRAGASDTINTPYQATQEMGSFHAWKTGQGAGEGNASLEDMLDTQAVAAAWVRAVNNDKKREPFSLPRAASAFFHH